ncbi:SMP-30/gluconolactonase/LRE family protein [Thermoproteota archaeon]
MVRHQNQKISPNLDNILGEAQVEKILSNYQFTEGPVWIPEGFLLFSDIPANTIYKYESGLKPEIFLKPSGHSNGLTLDQQGRLLICEHERRVIRLEKGGTKTILAEYYDGKRLNSPNDIVVKTDGSIYFTDPSFGLPNRTEGKELDFCGVYKIEIDGTITLLDGSVELPNGLAFSPDENTLYVDDSSSGHVYVFDVTGSGLLEKKRLFASVGGLDGKGGDGMKVDVYGNLFCTGPRGISVFDPNGVRYGVIVCPEIPANIAWGDNDYKSMYITARTGVYRLRVKTGGTSLIPDFTPTPVL